ncbi:MAG TPA: TolC family protein [Salinivirgaceae bacterium]|nr:TolC family protein [Salinivirgaceae bacterium]
MRKRWLLLMSFVAVIMIKGYSQNERAISIEDAISIALNENRTLQSANFDRQIASKSKWETITNYLPKLNFEASWVDNLKLNTVLLPGIMFGQPPGTYIPVQFGVEHQVNWSIKTQQLIFSAPLLVAIQLAEESKKLTELGYLRTENEVRTTVKTFYSSILILEQTRSIIEKNIQNLTSVKEKTKAMYELGMAQSTDVDQIDIAIAGLENSLSGLARNIELSINMLRFNLGMDSTTTLKLTSTIDQLINEQQIAELMVSSFIADNNVDFQLLKEQEELARLGLLKEKSDVLPTLAGFYNYSKNGQGNELSELRWFPSSMFGLSLSVPLFAGTQNYTQISKAKLSYEKAKYTTETVREQLLIQEKQLRFNLKNAYENYLSQKKNIDLAERVYRNIESKYLQGVASSLNLTQANTDYLKAESNFISACMELITAKHNLEKLLYQKQ